MATSCHWTRRRHNNKELEKLFGYDVDSFFDEENLVVKNFNKFKVV